jgi:soluble lytic murein transglycosylase-like protein
VTGMVRLGLLVFFAGSLLLAEDPYAARWAELRQRIETGGNVSQLMQQWEPKSLPRERNSAARSAGMSTVLPNMLASGLLDPTRDRVRAAACQVGVRPSLALAILEHETGFNNRARGEKGEIGAGQIMPSTAVLFGFDKSRLAADYDYNVQSSVGILRYLLDYFDGDEQATIRGYNGGPGWRSAGPVTLGKIESYAASVSRLRSKYVPVTCG